MKPKQFFFVALGLLVLVIGGGGYGFYYGYKQVKAKSTDLATQLAEKDAADQQINSLYTLQHEYNRDIIPIMPLIIEAMPQSKKQTEVLAQIERLASQSGLTLAGVSMPAPSGLPSDISQTSAADNVLALPISFKIDGTFQQLQDFTTHLENLNRYTNITALTVTSSDSSPNPDYSYNLDAYIKP